MRIETRQGSETTLESMQGRPAPPLQVTEWVHGDSVTLEELYGSVVLLDFWGVWCAPCVKLTPELVRLHRKYEQEGLVIIGIHTPHEAGEAAAYAQKHDLPYRVAIDMDRATLDAYRVDGYPDLYLIDRMGWLRFADVDQTTTGNLEKAIEWLLVEQVPPRDAPTQEPDAGSSASPPRAWQTPATGRPVSGEVMLKSLYPPMSTGSGVQPTTSA